jgi:hypothetical protein
MRRLAVSGALLVCVALVVAAWVRPFSESRINLRPYRVVPKPPLAAHVTNFSCINLVGASRRKRLAELHGPDWILESAIEPSCFPERDLILSSEISSLLIGRRMTARTHMWVTRKCDVIFVRIIESSGSEKQDMISVDQVTNHRCPSRSSKNCSVSSQLPICRGTSRWSRVRLRPCPDISWRLWCLVFAWRLGLCRGRSSCAVARRRCRREVRNLRRLAGVGYCPKIVRWPRSGCRYRRSDVRFLLPLRLRRLSLEFLLGCPFWTWRWKPSLGAEGECRLRWAMPKSKAQCRRME